LVDYADFNPSKKPCLKQEALPYKVDKGARWPKGSSEYLSSTDTTNNESLVSLE